MRLIILKRLEEIAYGLPGNTPPLEVLGRVSSVSFESPDVVALLGHLSKLLKDRA